MTSQGGRDPMSGLMSFAGLDGFDRPTMNAMRKTGAQQSPPNSQKQSRGASSAPSPQQPSVIKPPAAEPQLVVPAIPPHFSAASGSSAKKSFSGVGGAKPADPFDLDVLATGGTSTGIRPMKLGAQGAAGKLAGQGQASPPASRCVPAAAVVSPSTVSHTGFDDMFGTPAGAMSTPAQRIAQQNPEHPSYDPFAGIPQGGKMAPTTASHDPFDMFQTPGPPQASTSPVMPSPAFVTTGSDLLGGFEGTLDVVDHEPAGSSPNPSSSRKATVGSMSNASLTEDDWGSLTDASTASSPVPSPCKPAQGSARASRAEGLRTIQSAPSDGGAPPPTPPPPAYNDVVPGTGHARVAPDAGYHRAGPARSHIERPQDSGYQRAVSSSSRQQVERQSSQSDEDGQGLKIAADSRGGAGGMGRPGGLAAAANRGSSGNLEGVAEGAKEQARVWLQQGHSWLKSATDKVTKATKEAGVALQKGLGDLDSRLKNQGALAKGSRGDGLELPAYYYEWAAKISQLGPERRANTLAQLPEDDRLLVQRILDHAALQASEKSAARPSPAVASNVRDDDPATPAREGRSEARRPGGLERQGSGQVPDSRRPVSPRQPIPRAPPRPPPTPAPTPEADLLGFSAAAARHSPQAAPGIPLASAAARKLYVPAPPADADLLGLGGGGHSSGGAPSPTSSSPPGAGTSTSSNVSPSGMVQEDDLLGLHGPLKTTPVVARPPAPASNGPSSGPATSLPDDDDLLGAFTRPAPATARAAASPSPASSPAVHAELKEVFGAPRPARARPADSMIDFGDDEPDLPEGHAHLYADAAAAPGDGDEPEIRRLLRERRLAEKHQRMRQKLAEKHARDEAETAEKEAKVELRDQMRSRMEAWQAGKRENIRALLSTLHTVLWEDSGWKAPGLTDLVEVGKVKRWYMKANLIVHPDKVKQKGGSVEQIVVADMAFDALKVAWGKFESTEMRA